jgi:hypothetical protein
MIERPIVLGIDARRPRDGIPTIESELDFFGKNTGNLVFSEALYHVLSNARRSSYNFMDHELEGCDGVVIAAANWLNPYSDFSALALRLERTNLPVFVSGLGAQATLEQSIPSLKEGTLRLVKLAAERSAAISVRGDFTRDVLASYGVTNVVSTGCPSLLLSGPEAPQLNYQHPLDESRVCLQATRHVLNSADALQLHIYREAFRQNVDLVLQSELADSCYAGRRQVPSDVAARVDPVLMSVYDSSNITEIREYLAKRAKVFFLLDEWLLYMKTRSFCLGTRIHGTVMALLSGTPATLICHDSRTLEMAKKMNVPYVDSRKIDVGSPINIVSYLDPAGLEAFLVGYKTYYQEFMNFFKMNGLRVSAEYKSSQSAAQ